MVIRNNVTDVYYPVSIKVSNLIRGSGRIRYVRGSLLIGPKLGGTLAGSGARQFQRGGHS
jgi:hypothetical protein